MKSNRVSRACVRPRLFAAFVSFVVLALASQAAGLRVVNRSYPGIYFGSFAGGAGNFALYVRDDNTGTFLGYLPGSALGISHSTTTVDDSGQFTFAAGQAANAPLINGKIAADGTVSGTLNPAGPAASAQSFAGTRSASTGPTQALAGYYQAGASTSSSSSHTIISATGQAFALTQSGGTFDAGTGTATAAGQMNVTTARSTIAATISADTGAITVTSSGGLAATFAGGQDTAVVRQRLINISARARVATGENIAIAGFVIGGVEAKPVLIRAVGPTLATFGVTGALAAPRLDVLRGNILVATNSGVARASNATAIAAAARQAGAFALGTSGADAAIVTTLHPGAYTAQVSSATGVAGVALVEIYDLSAPAVGEKLLNVSTRGSTGAGEAVLTAGFVVPPGAAKRVLIRGVGPGLTRFGVQGALASPTLTLLNGTTTVAQNSNAATSPDAGPITNASAQAGAFALAAGDAGMVVTLPPGNYSVQLAGAGSATGVGLIEVYEAPVGDWNTLGGVPSNLLTESDLTRLRALSPLPAPPADPTNAFADNPAAAALGQKFFFDRGYGGPLGPIGVTGGHGALNETGKVSCNTCHTASKGFMDGVAISAGATALQQRNSMTLVNGVYYEWFNWAGNRDSFWLAGTAPGSSNGSLLSVAHRVYDTYRDEYNAVFTTMPLDPALDRTSPNAARFPRPTVVTNAAGVPALQGNQNDALWNSMTAADQQAVLRIVVNFAKAIGAYQRLLISRGAPFDRFIAGDASAISDQAKRGAALFVGKARCVSCHSGPLFSDNLFHNIGEGLATETGRAGANPATGGFSISSIYSDDREFGTAKLASILRDDTQTGAWRTPTLRNVAETAPYLRTGRIPTLEGVVNFYDAGNSKLPALNLTSDEKAALVAFMKTLTGQPIPEALATDTSVAP
jgi:cytochrome c peroxidase